MPNTAQNSPADEAKTKQANEEASKEKIVSLNEDSKHHEHDDASFNKLFNEQQARINRNGK